ncbi:unnamed protein product [Macrosiphum euphorbiae]|nr:unnamed protein product [Macrosiphum euphorbiae]
MTNNDVYPSVDKLLKFVRDRITVLENVGEPRKTSAKPKPLLVTGPYVSRRSGKSKPVALVAAKPTENRPQTTTNPCSCCQGSHYISTCPKFRSWSLDDRNRWAHENKQEIRLPKPVYISP